MTLMMNYYTQVNNQSEQQKILRQLKRQEAKIEARLIKKDYKDLKKRFKTEGQTIVSTTQIGIKEIQGKIDTGIRGKVGKGLKKSVDETLPKLDAIFDK